MSSEIIEYYQKQSYIPKLDLSIPHRMSPSAVYEPIDGEREVGQQGAGQAREGRGAEGPQGQARVRERACKRVRRERAD